MDWNVLSCDPVLKRRPRNRNKQELYRHLTSAFVWGTNQPFRLDSEDFFFLLIKIKIHTYNLQIQFINYLQIHFYMVLIITEVLFEACFSEVLKLEPIYPDHRINYTYLQNKRMRRCGVAPPTNNFRKT